MEWYEDVKGMTRLRRLFNDGYIPEPNSGCWLWFKAAKYTTCGWYGVIPIDTVLGSRGYTRQKGAHVVSYVLAYGGVPAGTEIDHTCRNTLCVNPAHLEAITHLENVRRGRGAETAKARHAARTHCKQGHLLTVENTMLRVKADRHGKFYNSRACRICHTVSWQKAEIVRVARYGPGRGRTR